MRGVSAASCRSGLMLPVCRSTSAKTGVAPAWMMVFAVAQNVSGVVMTVASPRRRAASAGRRCPNSPPRRRRRHSPRRRSNFGRVHRSSTTRAQGRPSISSIPFTRRAKKTPAWVSVSTCGAVVGICVVAIPKTDGLPDSLSVYRRFRAGLPLSERFGACGLGRLPVDQLQSKYRDQHAGRRGPCARTPARAGRPRSTSAVPSQSDSSCALISPWSS